MEEWRLGGQDGELKKVKETARNFYILGVEVDKSPKELLWKQ